MEIRVVIHPGENWDEVELGENRDKTGTEILYGDIFRIL